MRAINRRIGIITGYKCNFSCEHCCSPKGSALELTPAEESELVTAVSGYRMRSLHFLGGEPTLYIDKTNRFLSKLGNLKKHTIRITTNGHFAVTVPAAVATLSAFLKLNHVQLSYDKFHQRFLPYTRIKNLYRACARLKIGFGVVAAVESPLDLITLNKLKKLGNFQVGIQKVLPVGNAEKSGVYYKHPSFDRNVLSRKCPNRKVITFLPGKGFSICCATLAFGDKWRIACHATLKEHLHSGFYRMLTENSFRDIIRKAGLRNMEFSPEDSSPCVLCGAIFSKLDAEGVGGVFG